MNHVMNDESKQSNQYANRITPAILEIAEDTFFRQFELYLHFATHLHVDVCDGQMVQSLTVPYTAPGQYSADFFHQLDLKSIESEVHLMVTDPHNVGCEFIRAGAKRIITQWESYSSAEEVRGVVDSWSSRHAAVGLSVLVPTDLTPVFEYIESDTRIVSLQLMSIDPVGAQGRPFDTRVLQRIKDARARFPTLEISVDGSMNEQSIPTVFHAGASRAVVGSAVSKAEYPPDAYELLCTKVAKALRY